MKRWIAMLMALCLLFAMTACGQTQTSTPTNAPAESNPVVKIGIFEPASGDNGAGGKQETLGIEYANSVQPTVEIDGVTYDVVLVPVDNESSNDKAPSAASTLVSEGCSVVLGSYGSSVSMAGGPTFEAAGIPVIGVTCTNPQVTEGNTYYFRVCFLDPFQGPVLANYAYGNLSVTKAYCLSKLGDDYSGGLVNYFAEAFEGLGGEVVKAEFPEGNSDFSSYITSAKNEGCGVFFAPVSTEAAQLIISAAASQGLGMPLLAGDTWDSNVILEAAKGTDAEVTVTTFYASGTNPEFETSIREWISADSARLDKNGGNDMLAAVTVMGYDAYFVALEAIKAAGSADPAAVNEALWGVNYEGISGLIQFDENGDAIVSTAYVKGADTENGTWVDIGAVTIEG